jgi:hypothetical protein
MPENGRCDETFRAGAPVTLGPVGLLPIERVVLSAGLCAGLAWVAALKQPVALIVRDAGGIRALGIGDGPVALDALREKVPGLDAALAAM